MYVWGPYTDDIALECQIWYYQEQVIVLWLSVISWQWQKPGFVYVIFTWKIRGKWNSTSHENQIELVV